MLHTIRNPSPFYSIQRFFWNAVDWLYPPSCAVCGAGGQKLCSSCQQQIIPLDHSTSCLQCDLPNHTSLCPTCQSHPPQFDQLRSFSVYEGVIRQAIHRLKYHNDLPLADTLSCYLISLFNQASWDVDLICAVPLSSQKQRQRGYNQSALLAQILAWAVSIPYEKKAITRIRDTRSQVGLNAEERRENVKDAFRANPKLVNHKVVLVVDDIATTSATLSACAKALKEAGARNVYALTLARTIQLEQS